MHQYCLCKSEYIGLPKEECEVEWNSVVVEDGDNYCAFFEQVEDDPEHPSIRIGVCGNCIHYIVMEDK